MPITKAKRKFAIFSLLFLIMVPLEAHHSTANFDTAHELILQGRVKNFSWTNPHAYLSIEVEDSVGEKTVRLIEGPALTALRLVGWSEYSLTPGESIVVVANPSEDSNNTIVLGNSVLKENGEYLPMGGMRLQEALADRNAK